MVQAVGACADAPVAWVGWVRLAVDELVESVANLASPPIQAESNVITAQLA